MPVSAGFLASVIREMNEAKRASFEGPFDES